MKSGLFILIFFLSILSGYLFGSEKNTFCLEEIDFSVNSMCSFERNRKDLTEEEKEKRYLRRSKGMRTAGIILLGASVPWSVLTGFLFWWTGDYDNFYGMSLAVLSSIITLGAFISGVVLLCNGVSRLRKYEQWLEESHVSPEISFVPEEKSSARGSSLSPWENSRLSLALKVRF